MPKRKRTYANGRSIKRRRKGTTGRPPVVRKLRTGIARNNRALVARPVSFGNLQPTRVRTRHVNYLSSSVLLDDAQPFWADAESFQINVLRDPQVATENQVYPENFVNMARMYEKYLVHGVKITCYFNGQSNNENDRFISIFYSSDSGTVSYGPGTTVGVNAVLQEKGIRRWKLYDASHYTPGHNVQKAGTWGCARASKDPNYYTERAQYAGEVAADGTVVADPVKKVYVHHQILSPQNGGFVGGGDQTLFIRYKLEFDVEWYDRRLVVEATRTEV